MLTVEECWDGTGQAFIFPRTLTGITVAVATHTGELVIVEVGPRWAVGVARHPAQQRVWIKHKSLLALGALVRLGPGAATARLMALCNPHEQ